MTTDTVCPQCLGRNGRHNSDCIHRDDPRIASAEGDEQRVITARRKAQAADIVDSAKLDTLERAKAFAQAWVETALQTAANEMHQADKRAELRGELDATTAVLARVTRDNAQLTTHLTDVQERGSALVLELQDARFKLQRLYEAWPHWQCQAVREDDGKTCGTFNGEAKMLQDRCRACNAPRPTDAPRPADAP